MGRHPGGCTQALPHDTGRGIARRFATLRPTWRTAMNIPDLNWLAILAAAVSAFVLGGLWYGPLFKRAWCREAGIDPDAAPKHPARIFAVAFACSLLAAAVFAVFLGRDSNPADGFAAGGEVGPF